MGSWYVYCFDDILSHSVEDQDVVHSNQTLANGTALCLQQAFFPAAAHGVLAVCSAAYAGAKHSTVRPRKLSWVLIARIVLSLLLLVNSLFVLVASFWLAGNRSYAQLLFEIVEAFSWLVHILCLGVICLCVVRMGFGPLLLHFSWLLTLVTATFQFKNIVEFVTGRSGTGQSDPDFQGYFSLLMQVTVYVRFGIQCLYLITVPLPLCSQWKTGLLCRKEHTAINVATDSQPLLKGLQPSNHVISSHTIRGYGSLRRYHPRQQHSLEALEDNASWLSRLTFWWLEPLMRKGSLGLLQRPDDLPHLPHSLQTAVLRDKFQELSRKQNHQPLVDSLDVEVEIISRPRGTSAFSSWSSSRRRRRSSSTSQAASIRPSLFSILNQAFGMHYYPLGVLKLTSDCLGFAGPLLLHALVKFMEEKTEPMSHGYYYALGLFLSTLLSAILTTHFNYQVAKVGLKVRGAIITEVYRKALSVNSVTMRIHSTGQVVNYMSTDTDRIVNFCQSFHQFWSLPFQIVISLYLLYQQVSLAFLAGVGFSVLLVPVNRWLAVKIGKLSTSMMMQKDQRVKLMAEILRGIRVIKFYTWERVFSQRIKTLRSAELHSLKGRKYLDALCVYFWATTPVLISILVFATYKVVLKKELTAAKVFTSIALFNMLISPLNAFPWVINGLIEAYVSLKRVQSFLSLPELSLSHYYSPLLPECNDTNGDAEGKGSSAKTERHQNDVIRIVNGHFSWRAEDRTDSPGGSAGESPVQEPEEWLLHGADVSICKGDFVGVVGKVGSGKSSLLAAVLAEMRKKEGEVMVADHHEGFALVAQEPWIQHATIRDNILFGRPFDPCHYSNVVYACALEPDLKILPAGDMTEVGENGVTLSGGQKARLSLARAVYQDKEIYLLDGPLAAVDAHVANHLYTYCILGLLREKTRILCTHHVGFLRNADCIIVMEDGRVSHIGPPQSVMTFAQSQLRETTNEDVHQSSLSLTLKRGVIDQGRASEEPVLVREEEKGTGVVAPHVYLSYWAAVGSVLAPAIFLALFLMQASRNISDLWLSIWVSHSHNTTTSSTSDFTYTAGTDNVQGSLPTADDVSFYLGIYGGLAAANSVFTLFRAFLFAYGGIRAAQVLHSQLLAAILKAPVIFFDITPIGRIINRFSSDMYAIDDSLPFIMNILLAQIFSLLGTLAVTCYGLPWFILVLVPLAILYFEVQQFYRITSRELKRLCTITLSPVYAHFSETLAGLATIRAMRSSDRFMEENLQKLDINQRANYGSYAVAQWLGVRLQMFGVVMVAGVSFIAVLQHHFSTVNPGLVGLAISYALSVTNLLSGVVTSFTETEKQMVSVERASQYIRGAPQERSDEGRLQREDWPRAGVVEFNDAVLIYRTGLPPALNKVSFVTRPSEKVGVVGRTGSGKSSLFQALFRMVELTSGAVLIDGVDTATVSLEQLRSGQVVIPQDPFLFSGSVRENLDPAAKHTDMEVWSALERCHLKEVVERLGGLKADVQERGEAFSVGQRQLVCLARALLTQSKIICIDEATASVDIQTDSQIQHTIRREFATSTVITIAHRIETVLNCDRILVMSDGRVEEFDSPAILLGDPSSLFSSLYHEHARKQT